MDDRFPLHCLESLLQQFPNLGIMALLTHDRQFDRHSEPASLSLYSVEFSSILAEEHSIFHSIP